MRTKNVVPQIVKTVKQRQALKSKNTTFVGDSIAPAPENVNTIDSSAECFDEELTKKTEPTSADMFGTSANQGTAIGSVIDESIAPPPENVNT